MRTLLILVFVCVLLGCTMFAPPPTAIPTPSPTEGSVFIDARDPTVSVSPPATAAIAPPAELCPNCTIRTDWFLYWVAHGETLSSIARRSMTTVAVLANANCLANPNLIYAGQWLRVPVILPPPITNTPTQPPTAVATAPVPPPTESPTVLPYD